MAGTYADSRGGANRAHLTAGRGMAMVFLMTRGPWPASRSNPPSARGLGRGGNPMHPGMISWWKARNHHGGCGVRVEHGVDEDGVQAGGEEYGGYGGGAFGVRRPLRFLAYKLNLS